jgi:hypothetical protein
MSVLLHAAPGGFDCGMHQLPDGGFAAGDVGDFSTHVDAVDDITAVGGFAWIVECCCGQADEASFDIFGKGFGLGEADEAANAQLPQSEFDVESVLVLQ